MDRIAYIIYNKTDVKYILKKYKNDAIIKDLTITTKSLLEDVWEKSKYLLFINFEFKNTVFNSALSFDYVLKIIKNLNTKIVDMKHELFKEKIKIIRNG